MKSLNVCFVGIGSIARRHIKNLQVICSEKRINLNIDAVRRSSAANTKDENLLLRKVYTNYDEMDNDYDI